MIARSRAHVAAGDAVSLRSSGHHARGDRVGTVVRLLSGEPPVARVRWLDGRITAVPVAMLELAARSVGKPASPPA